MGRAVPKIIRSKEYRELLSVMKARIHQAQYDALRAVNRELVALYWDIGQMIVNRQKGDSWGKAVVELLAADLQKELPRVRGFSAQNLWRMKQFYQAYVVDEKLSPMVREISWTHNVIILMGCKDPLEREFYIRMTRRMGWTKNVLTHQIDNKAYEKTILNQTNFEQTLPGPLQAQARLSVKDEYAFDFLELGEDHSERELERGVMVKMNRFLLEMGGVFTFVGSRYRLEVDGQEFFIDILLYHRRLKCLVAIELKVGEFQPEYAGKMQFYLSALDDLVREEGEGPSIGIILCRNKRKTIVEYTLRDSRKPIGVAKYRVVSMLPQELKNELPAPEVITEMLCHV